MVFSVEVDEGINIPGITVSDIFRQTALEALRFTDCPYECEVSLTITDDDTIRTVNKEYRGIDKATDVLSFPFLEFKAPGDFSGVSELDPDSFNPDTGDLMLGDIMVSADHVIAQAEDYGHSVKREFAFLIAHSMLHLQGFDHIKADDAAEMEKAQNEILERLGIRR